MDHYKKYYIFIFLLFIAKCGISQPAYIYEGGNGEGYSSDSAMESNAVMYTGSIGSGYAFGIKSLTHYLYSGGSHEGYTSLEWENTNLYFYFGGEGEGYTHTKNNTPLINQFEGGNNDGYTFAEKCEDFIWTGALGTGWAVADNWNYNMVPDLKRRAIIPADVPSFPFVNAGIFAIGKNPNNGAFVCRALWIQDGALLVTRINNNVENYGKILIDGTMQVKKSSLDAFQNLENGLVRISPTGSLLIKP